MRVNEKREDEIIKKINEKMAEHHFLWKCYSRQGYLEKKIDEYFRNRIRKERLSEKPNRDHIAELRCRWRLARKGFSILDKIFLEMGFLPIDKFKRGPDSPDHYSPT